MGALIPINSACAPTAEDFLKKIQEGLVTHGVFVFRTVDGSVMYKLFGSDHRTYLVGLIERVKAAIFANNQADEY